MKRFSELIDALGFAGGRNAKLQLMAEWLGSTPDPDRGWGLAALTGELDLPAVKPALIRALIETEVDPVLFRLSYDYVGDLAETVALLWPHTEAGAALTLGETVATLQGLSRSGAPGVLRAMLSRMDSSERHALLKLATGALRVGAGARLAKQAFANRFGVGVEEVEELWHGVSAPYAELFAWATGAGPRPDLDAQPLFRPFMLAHPLESPEALEVAAFSAEWKWDGIRAMAVCRSGEKRLYSRDGNDISATFPEIVAALDRDVVIDGELLVRGADGAVGSFNALQQRLGRKAVSAAMLRDYPVFVRAYDLLFDGREDVRALPLEARRARLQAVVATLDPERFDFSQSLEAETLEALAQLRGSPPDPAIEGLMLKRRTSAYVPGRKAGLWYKWKRDARIADCVLMYAQRGHGKRSSFYSDFTFGAWEGEALLPVGKAYFGFTDAELKWLDAWVRAHTTARFGPVREVEKALVLEVAFDSIGESKRHKSGLAMRFPRISRIRQDKPAAEADTVETLRRMTI